MPIEAKDFEDEKLLSLEAKGLFEGDEFGDNPNKIYCFNCATFTHSHDASEYVLHIGTDGYWEQAVQEMEKFGCTQDFIDAYLLAKDLGAVRLLIWEG